ncbi:hypothetical protein RGQ29_002682 [Quercus rubra]|uniref:RBR-type E3 ubiquitin transferase n=1 Tax=Quercus rubra TaxID=3512 RepID=A0AAN7E9S6_QUERU|nr:hypothetical protein RGQ29_002682 [Quercus rubra]
MGNTIQKTSQTSIKSQQEAAHTSTFDCQICLEPIISNKKFYNKETCFHIFCVDCVSKYIHAKVEDSVANIRCPGMNCGKLLDPFSCQPIIPKRLFDRWMNLLCISKILGFRKCFCPNRSCSVLVINEGGGKEKRSKCPKCKQPFCFDCKVPWKSGHLCNQKRDDIDVNDILLVEAAQAKGWIRCPRCNIWVERAYGYFSTITCRCGTRFCYKCGRKTRLECKCVDCYSILLSLLFLLIFLLLVFYIIFILLPKIR